MLADLVAIIASLDIVLEFPPRCEAILFGVATTSWLGGTKKLNAKKRVKVKSHAPKRNTRRIL